MRCLSLLLGAVLVLAGCGAAGSTVRDEGPAAIGAKNALVRSPRPKRTPMPAASSHPAPLASLRRTSANTPDARRRQRLSLPSLANSGKNCGNRNGQDAAITPVQGPSAGSITRA